MLADANEYVALQAADDGTPEGALRRNAVETFFKGAGAEKIPGPAQSESPTGVQATPPASGAKKILPLGLASGNSPAESEAPTGTQATIGQEPPAVKKAGDEPMTLLDLISKQGDAEKIQGPGESEALQNSAAPPAKNENTNIDLVRSSAAIEGATKRDAKMPTRARLKQLFAHAGDTGPSSAAAQAAFPNAYAKGGMKVAAIALTDAGHALEAASARATATAQDRFRRAKNEYTSKQPLLSYVQGMPLHSTAHQLVGRHAAYVDRKHSSKRQSLNPFGGLLTASPDEKKASLSDYMDVYEAAAAGQFGDDALAIVRFTESLNG